MRLKGSWINNIKANMSNLCFLPICCNLRTLIHAQMITDYMGRGGGGSTVTPKIDYGWISEKERKQKIAQPAIPSGTPALTCMYSPDIEVRLVINSFQGRRIYIMARNFRRPSAVKAQISKWDRRVLTSPEDVNVSLRSFTVPRFLDAIASPCSWCCE